MKLIKNNIWQMLSKEDGEINMIAIVLILIVVIMLAVIFKDSMSALLDSIFKRINDDISNF